MIQGVKSELSKQGSSHPVRALYEHGDSERSTAPLRILSRAFGNSCDSMPLMEPACLEVSVWSVGSAALDEITDASVAGKFLGKYGACEWFTQIVMGLRMNPWP